MVRIVAADGGAGRGRDPAGVRAVSERFLTADEQRCMRNAIRRCGRVIPPPADSIAGPLTDDELAELIRDLVVILIARRCSA